MKSFGRILRRRLIAGLIVIAPLGVTVYILYLLFTTLDGILGRSLYERIGYSIPGLGLVLLVILLLAVGWAAEATLGAKVLNWWHMALHHRHGVRRRGPSVLPVRGPLRVSLARPVDAGLRDRPGAPGPR
jgi:hypothetical protein